MILFADTNWLEALYFKPAPDDPASVNRAAIVARRMRKISGPITVSQIVLLEARNVFGRVSGEMDPVQWRNLSSDLHHSVLVDPFDWPALREAAHRIFERFSHKANIGSFDAAILASAELANASEFLSFDEGIKIIAASLGIRVFPELTAGGKRKLAAIRA